MADEVQAPPGTAPNLRQLAGDDVGIVRYDFRTPGEFTFKAAR